MSSYPVTPGSPPSPSLEDLYARRDAIDAEISRKRRKLAPPFEPSDELKLINQFGEDFVRDIGVETLKKLPEIGSLSDFDKDPSIKMARGGEENAPFLAFRIELLSQGQARVCVLTAKVFQTLFLIDDAQYTSASFLEGEDELYYPSPIFSKETGREKREVLRDLIEGRKFPWKPIEFKKSSDGAANFTSAGGTSKVRYFRILGGTQ